jgi:hypothetical protein
MEPCHADIFYLYWIEFMWAHCDGLRLSTNGDFVWKGAIAVSLDTQDEIAIRPPRKELPESLGRVCGVCALDGAVVHVQCREA